MSTVEQAIQYTQLFQDVELAQALQQLRNDPQAMQRFLQNAQNSLYKSVTEQKDDTFQKVYGDLERASSAQKAIYYYNLRNNDLNNLQDAVFQAQKGSADAVIHDRDLAKRQVEINQWSSGNKMDSLFVYSQAFIFICTVILISYLWIQGILSTSIFTIIGTILLIIFVFTVVNRAQYTIFLRDSRYWNRRQFPTFRGIPAPNICNTNINQVEADSVSAENTLKQWEQQATSAVSGGIQQATSAVSGDIQQVMSNF